MRIRTSFALLALVIGAGELSAQVSTRERARDRVIYGDGRVDTRTGGGIGDIIFGRTSTNSGTYSKVPKGHLPPRGACRVWIDGVSPGQQPPVTSCAQAERDRLRYPNSRVIYGDVESFPGKGKGKFKKAERNGEVIRRDDDARRAGVYDRTGVHRDADDDSDGRKAGKFKEARNGKGKEKSRG